MTNVDHLIQVVNKLQDCFGALGKSCPIDLPQIAVVGEQSAGKSSVLENFVGKGNDIVTRRPLVLQLINHNGEDKKYTDFDLVRKEIEDETDRETGNTKNVSPVPINLKVYSPHVLNLTLVDLPGLTKIALAGQAKDIEQQIRNMIHQYISQEKCLILAVIPAIIDLANSEALKLADQVDPQRNRTIGVLTKIDMMGEGTDCVETLENRLYHLKRGYVGIVNRSQQDIKSRKSLRDAQESELEFFRNHPAYKHMTDRLGSRFLQQTLNMQLSQHIRESLPALRQQILDEISQLENKLGPKLHEDCFDDTERTKIFMVLVQEFSKNIDVVLGYQQEFVDTQELSGGSNINKTMYQRFPYELSKIRPDPIKMRSEIKMAIINSQGVRSSIFTSDIAFLSVVRKRIEETRSSCCRVPELVGAEVLKIIDKACAQIFSNYPSLLAEIITFCQEQLAETIAIAKRNINFYMDAEAAHINTKHPDFCVFERFTRFFISDKGGEDSPKRVDRGHDQTIYRQGYLTISGQGYFKSSKTDYFVLKGSLLTAYKDERLSEQKLQILLDGVHIRESESFSRKHGFQLYNTDGKPLSRDLKTLELAGQTSEEVEEWKAAFLAAGVPTDLKVKNNSPQNSETDPNLIKSVEYIFALVTRYLQIVNKTQVDLISKICVSCIITRIRCRIQTDIVAKLVGSNSIEKLMKESEEVLSERKKMRQTYNACKEAMEHIQSIMCSMGLDSSGSRLPNIYKTMKIGGVRDLKPSSGEPSYPFSSNNHSRYRSNSSRTNF